MYMVICRGLNSSMYKYSLVNLNTLKTTTVTKREILDLINNGKILTNVIVNLGDIEIINCPTRDNKYVICEYGDKLLELEYDGVIMTEYVVSDKGRYTGSTLLPKVSKELLDKVDDMYRKHIDKSCTLGIKQRFNYIVLNEDNILLDRFLETSDIMYVPKFINSITENAMSSQNRRIDGLIGFGYYKGDLKDESDEL